VQANSRISSVDEKVLKRELVVISNLPGVWKYVKSILYFQHVYRCPEQTGPECDSVAVHSDPVEFFDNFLLPGY